MTKVTVEIELDNAEYDKHYGPGSEFWARHGTKQQINPDGQWVSVPKADSEYKSLVGKALNDAIVETLCEGFYNWASVGWLKLTVDGKAVRDCCYTVEGDAHANWCPKVSGPEASETYLETSCPLCGLTDGQHTAACKEANTV